MSVRPVLGFQKDRGAPGPNSLSRGHSRSKLYRKLKDAKRAEILIYESGKEKSGRGSYSSGSPLFGCQGASNVAKIRWLDTGHMALSAFERCVFPRESSDHLRATGLWLMRIGSTDAN